MTDDQLEKLAKEVGLICRCVPCCCPAGRGHNHLRFDEYLDEVMLRSPRV